MLKDHKDHENKNVESDEYYLFISKR